MLLIVVGLILFVLLVVVHEFGHFIAARRGNVDVEEFGIGFPPKLWRYRTDKKGTEYTINALPLGGFVRLKGEHDMDTEKGSFGAAKLKTKVKIMLAGVGMNLITAWLVLLILALIGMPQLPLPNNTKQFTVKNDANVVSQMVYLSYIEPDSPAAKAGLEARDRIIKVTPQCTEQSTEICKSDTDIIIKTNKDLESATKKFAGSLVTVTYIRSGQERTTQATLLSSEVVESSQNTDDPKGYLGVVPYNYSIIRSTWSAPIVATGLTLQFTKLTLAGIGNALKDLVSGNAKEASQNVSGPIGIFFVLKEGAVLGMRYTLIIIALLSLTLAIMNALPIPALDGGRLFVTLLFRGLKKPLTPKLEERIHGTGFVALLGLIVLISVVDVRRFF